MKKSSRDILYRTGGYIFLLALLLFNNRLLAQCPANIDFEAGNFNGWQCWSGSVEEVNMTNVMTLLPVSVPDPAMHIMMSANPGDGVDKYGLFPKNCPNGSGHSVQLGNELNGHLAQGLSYQFTIPATANKFRLLVNYAIVWQDPDHSVTQQPRFEVETTNLTDNVTMTCPSGSLVSGNTPGFTLSATRLNNIQVYYRNWSGFSVNLDGNAGKTFRIFFRTAGCTFVDHFCYAYLDINSLCDGTFETSAYCPGDTAVNLKGPVGYKNYTWFSNNFAQVLGTEQTLHLNPPPAAGSVVALEIKPVNGIGCTDTLTTKISDTLSVKGNAGPDFTICNSQSVQIGTLPLPGRTYSWAPVTYLSDPNISNPVASPPIATQYVLTVRSEGGGCSATDTMKVFTKIVGNDVTLTGSTTLCIGFGTLPFLRINAADSVQWFRDSVAITGATQPLYTVNQSGKYYALLFDYSCPLPFNTKETAFFIDVPTPGITYPTVDAVFNFQEPLHARQFGNSVTWSPATSLSDAHSYSPVFTGVNPQLYTIEIKTLSGCITVDTQMVKTHKKIAVYVPTAFTPDGNGVNDYLRPLLMGFAKVNYFRIYDRWGRLLFSMNSDQPGWDGKVNNQPVETQTVVWMLEAVDLDGKTHTEKGTTVLFR
ncbi:T9SS type B sorting domain-containing protein [Ferruginibacter sp.]